MKETRLKKTHGLHARALAALPLAPLRIACRRLILTTVRRHPGVFDRLGPYAGRFFLVNPVDLPVCFVFHAGDGGPQLRPVRSPSPDDYDAIISGPISALWQMARAKDDGDALFFSRKISISGDTEAVLALRNAMDDMDSDMLDEILASLGPLRRPAQMALGAAAGIHRRGMARLSRIRDAITAPVRRENAALGKRIAALEAARSPALKKTAKKRAAI